MKSHYTKYHLCDSNNTHSCQVLALGCDCCDYSKKAKAVLTVTVSPCPTLMIPSLPSFLMLSLNCWMSFLFHREAGAIAGFAANIQSLHLEREPSFHSSSQLYFNSIKTDNMKKEESIHMHIHSLAAPLVSSANLKKKISGRICFEDRVLVQNIIRILDNILFYNK